MFGIGRREFITLLGGAAVAWPLAVRAQQPAMPVIGFLGATTPSAQKKWTDAFVQRLRELDWIEGRNVAILYRWAEGRTERAPEIFAEFIRLKVEVIVTHPTALAVAANRSYQLCSRWRETRLAVASSQALPDRAATSPDCRSKCLMC
jgi:putative tryptophan/tyrosine transport system substrate-binding protein